MTDKTVSIFCIGTGHNSNEEYNILRILYDLTNTESGWVVSRMGGKQTGSQLFNPPQRMIAPDKLHHKILYDGAPNLPDVGGKASGDYLVNVADNALELIKSVSLDGNEKLKVNLVGHSRGAVNCLLIATRLFREMRNADCNLFLIDAVKVIGVNKKLITSRVPEDKTRLLFENVKNCTHIVMEDDVKYTELNGFLKMGIFVLYEFEKVQINPPQMDIEQIRFPGTHGSATQCNPMARDGEEIPALPSGKLIPAAKDMWPIGGAALSLALQKLKSWGTPLHDDGRALATEEKEFWFLNRVQLINRFITPFSKKRLINDSKQSISKENQEVDLVPGGINKVLYRPKELLDRFTPNLLRHHPVFINQRHVDLAIKFLGEPLISDVIALVNDRLAINEDNQVFEAPGPPTEVDVRDLHIPAEFSGTAAQTFATLQLLIPRYPTFFNMLTDKGYTWKGQPLDFKLVQGNGAANV